MVYRSVRPQPPRGSTEWGARQFYRLLDDEERIAAERERLLAMGWRPTQATAAPFSDEPTFGDERDAYADMMQQDLALRRALDEEAKRRVEAQLARPMDTAPGWIGGGRFGVPIPPDSARTGQSASDSSTAQYTPAGTSDVIKTLLPWVLGALGAAEIGRESTDQDNGSNWNPFDLGSWGREIAPPEQPSPPPPHEPGPKEFARPQPGFPGLSGNLGQKGRPAVPIPHPPGFSKPDVPKPDPLPEDIGNTIPGTLPEILDKFWQAGILIRNESDSTRQDNADIIEMASKQMEECGWKAKHTHGVKEKERHFPPEEGGMLGSRRSDGTVEGTSPDGRRKVIFDFNTARKLQRPSRIPGQKWEWVAYERRAESPIRLLKQKLDALRDYASGAFGVYPKSLGGDRAAWRDEVRPYVQEAVRALLNC